MQSHVIEFLKNCKLPVVVKADGLAAEKGYICKSKQVLRTTLEIFNENFPHQKK